MRALPADNTPDSCGFCAMEELRCRDPFESPPRRGKEETPLCSLFLMIIISGCVVFHGMHPLPLPEQFLIVVTPTVFPNVEVML